MGIILENFVSIVHNVLSWLYTNVFATLFIFFVGAMFNRFMDRRVVKVIRSDDGEPWYACIAVNTGKRNIGLKSHGLRSLTGRDCSFPICPTVTLAEHAYKRLDYASENTYAENALMHKECIYKVYVVDVEGKEYAHFPNRIVFSWLKRFIFWCTNKEPTQNDIIGLTVDNHDSFLKFLSRIQSW